MNLYAGTSGFSYKEWKGPFYPEKIKNDELLAYYATRLSAVEINNTFYRMPRTSVLEGCEILDYLFETMSVLEERLGVVFFQLPPNFKKDPEKLAAFLDELPEGVKAAFEFRHESWFDDETYEILKKKNCALCLADADNDLDVPLVSTADWGYLRLRQPKYRKPDLEKWIKWVRDQNWKDAYIFFKHEDAAGGPKMAERFLELAGM